MNQSAAREATASSLPGSSNRWVAPGTTIRLLRHARRACASRFSASTSTSRPPTISSVGARTERSAGPARSGRPPRETTAPTIASIRGRREERGGRAGARAEVADRAARPTARAPPDDRWRRPDRSGQQPDVEDVPPIGRFGWGSRRSNSRVPRPEAWSRLATHMFRGLARLLPLPCANRTRPTGASGIVSVPGSSNAPP